MCTIGCASHRARSASRSKLSLEALRGSERSLGRVDKSATGSVNFFLGLGGDQTVVIPRGTAYCTKLTTEEAREVSKTVAGIDPDPSSILISARESRCDAARGGPRLHAE